MSNWTTLEMKAAAEQLKRRRHLSEHLSRYELKEPIGKGAHGAAYSARDRVLNRAVVVKVLDVLGNPSLAARAENEAKAASRLHHPLVTGFVDVIAGNGFVATVTESIAGKTLAEVLADSPLHLAEVGRFSQDILSALAYIHSQDVVHGDVKPANVIIRESDGRAVLCDFGNSFIQTSRDAEAPVRRGSLAGTIAYMAPEIPLDEGITSASDVYSAGCLLYEMLTGSVPFAAETASRSIELRTSTIAKDVSELRPKTPSKLSALISSMLAKEPMARPSSDQCAKVISGIAEDEWLSKEAIPSGERIPASEASEELFRSIVGEWNEKPSADFKRAATPYFATPTDRYEAIQATSRFYEEHLAKEYGQLLFQARVSFGLWVGFGVTAFLVLVAGVLLLYTGNLLSGAVTIASEALLLFIQKLFKVREDHYRAVANRKTRNLELGGHLSIAMQCIDAILVPDEQSEKTARLADALIEMVRDVGEDD